MRKHTSSINILILLLGGLPCCLGAANAGPQQSGMDRPVSSQEIGQLKQELSDSTSSSVEGIFEYHSESGDVNNRLDFVRYGARVNYRWQPGTILYLQGTGTSYRTIGNVLDENGANLTAGLKSDLSDAVEVRFEAGATRFGNSGTTVNALGKLRLHASGGSSLYVTGSRTNVEESLLSAAGIRPATGPFAGQLVGEVMDNRIVAGGLLKLTRRFDIFGEGGGGQRDGKNIESNSFRTASGGAGYNLVAAPVASPVSLFRVSYDFDYFGFDKNLLGYGGVSLSGRRGTSLPVSQIGSDGISPVSSAGNPGTGGYFSPNQFISNVGRAELRGRLSPAIEYNISGFAGMQDYTGSTARQAAGFFGSVTIRLNDRFSVPVTYLRDNFGPFTQQSFFVRLAVKI